jgi:hypothetical protein
LLDADTLIRAEKTYYPRRRFPVFWDWLLHQGKLGNVKIPPEQYGEVVIGRGELVDWLKEEETKEALLLDEEVDVALVADTTVNGYAANLNEAEIETVGRDPFLIAHARTDQANRRVITFEVSKPGKQRANRKVPDVCASLRVQCGTLFDLIEDLDFSTDWKP